MFLKVRNIWVVTLFVLNINKVFLISINIIIKVVTADEITTVSVAVRFILPNLFTISVIVIVFAAFLTNPAILTAGSVIDIVFVIFLNDANILAGVSVNTIELAIPLNESSLLATASVNTTL